MLALIQKLQVSIVQSVWVVEVTQGPRVFGVSGHWNEVFSIAINNTEYSGFGT